MNEYLLGFLVSKFYKFQLFSDRHKDYAQLRFYVH